MSAVQPMESLCSVSFDLLRGIASRDGETLMATLSRCAAFLGRYPPYARGRGHLLETQRRERRGRSPRRGICTRFAVRPLFGASSRTRTSLRHAGSERRRGARDHANARRRGARDSDEPDRAKDGAVSRFSSSGGVRRHDGARARRVESPSRCPPLCHPECLDREDLLWTRVDACTRLNVQGGPGSHPRRARRRGHGDAVPSPRHCDARLRR
mmetsp:Transcript_9769/g.39740  ORF Transcript_9769/g.39740 Transcript_9769/m.39740 type:complete len:212 (-) Transcript_9769:84-719(-)